MSDLKAYLAANYMSGPKADAILARSSMDGTMKKRRKKVKREEYDDYAGGRVEAGPSGAGNVGGVGGRGMIVDEDERVMGDDDDEGEDAPVVGKDIATFQKGKSAWATVGSSALPVLGSVKTEPLDPSDPSEPSGSSNPPLAESSESAPAPKKRRGGLRRAADLAAEVAERERLESEARAGRSPSPPPDQGSTVHRDASGRVVDLEQLRAEARREAEEERRKEAEKKEWSKGLVQRGNRAEREREEVDMASRDVARYADDARMNAEMREVERWNDPAANFTTTQKKKKGPRWPTYQGAYPPNRFHIVPGYRWDGVDRSTGFEKKYFAYQNAAARRVYEGNQMDVEDL